MFAITPNTLSAFLNSISKYIVLLMILLLGFSAILITLLENDYYQGVSFKIMFIHVPAAWLSLLIFSTMGISSIIGLVYCIYYLQSNFPYWPDNEHNRSCNRIHLGKSYLGYLLGLGRKINFNAYSFLYLLGTYSSALLFWSFSKSWFCCLNFGYNWSS